MYFNWFMITDVMNQVDNRVIVDNQATVPLTYRKS